MTVPFTCPNATSATPADVVALYMTLFIVYTAISFLGFFLFLLARRYYGRLRKRSAILVFISLMGSFAAYVVIFLRESIGQEIFSCRLIIIGHYLILPLVIGPMVAKLRVNMHRVRRAKALVGVSFDTIRRAQALYGNSEALGPTTWGFANFMTFNLHTPVAAVSESPPRASPSTVTESEDHFTVMAPGAENLESDEDDEEASAPPGKKSQQQLSSPRGSSLKPSSRSSSRGLSLVKFMPARASSIFLSPPSVSEQDVALEELVRDDSIVYGVMLVCLFALPFCVALIVRATTDPVYSNGCLGCAFETEDTIIVLILASIMVVPYLWMMWLTWNAPDPLGIIIEARMTFYLGVVFALPIFILYMADPGNIQVHLFFSWLTIEATGVMCIMIIQTYAQVYLARKANIVPASINLLRSLENSHLRPLFEEHLMGEFSVENLRFWDRATRFKLHYDVLQASDRDRIANELYAFFIKEDVPMMLNLAHRNRDALAAIFGHGPAHNVDRKVFDGALKEAYLLMTDGLSRFVRTKQYKSIKRSDLEGDQMRSIEQGIDLDSGVDAYLASLDSAAATRVPLHRNSAKPADRRVSFIGLARKSRLAASIEGPAIPEE